MAEAPCPMGSEAAPSESNAESWGGYDSSTESYNPEQIVESALEHASPDKDIPIVTDGEDYRAAYLNGMNEAGIKSDNPEAKAEESWQGAEANGLAKVISGPEGEGCTLALPGGAEKVAEATSEFFGQDLSATPEDRARGLRFSISHEAEHCRVAEGEHIGQNTLYPEREARADISAAILERARGVESGELAEADSWLTRYADFRERSSEDPESGNGKYYYSAPGMRAALELEETKLREIGYENLDRAELDRAIDWAYEQAIRRLHPE